MDCESSDGNGWCTTRFNGFACVGDKCSLHPEFLQEVEDCPDDAGDGVYCRRFNRFFCTGKIQCTELEEYNRRMLLG